MMSFVLLKNFVHLLYFEYIQKAFPFHAELFLFRWKKKMGKKSDNKDNFLMRLFGLLRHAT